MSGGTRPTCRAWVSLALLVAATWGLSQGLQWWRDQQQAERVAAVLAAHRPQAHEVVMFTTSTCPYCRKARQWLQQHGVPFEECNVETSATCQQRYEQQGSPGVPLMQVRGHWHLGFEPEWLLLALQKPPYGASSTPSPSTNQSPSTDGSPRP